MRDDQQAESEELTARFWFEQTDPGTHKLKASQVLGPIKFTCSAGSSVFF